MTKSLGRIKPQLLIVSIVRCRGRWYKNALKKCPKPTAHFYISGETFQNPVNIVCSGTDPGDYFVRFDWCWLRGLNGIGKCERETPEMIAGVLFPEGIQLKVESLLKSVAVIFYFWSDSIDLHCMCGFFNTCGLMLRFCMSSVTSEIFEDNSGFNCDEYGKLFL